MKREINQQTPSKATDTAALALTITRLQCLSFALCHFIFKYISKSHFRQPEFPVVFPVSVKSLSERVGRKELIHTFRNEQSCSQMIMACEQKYEEAAANTNDDYILIGIHSKGYFLSVDAVRDLE